MPSLTRAPACRIPSCPHPRDPDWHRCWCGGLEIEHHHVESRGMGGSKLKRHIVALCHEHHEKVTLHECYDIVVDIAGANLLPTYTYKDTDGTVLHERVLEAGSAAAEDRVAQSAERRVGKSKDASRPVDAGSSPVPDSSAAAPPASGAGSSKAERPADSREYVGSNPTRAQGGGKQAAGVTAAQPFGPVVRGTGAGANPAEPASGESSAAEAGAVNPDTRRDSMTDLAAPPSLETWCREGMELVYMGLAFRDATDGLRFAIGDWFNKGEGFLSEEVHGYLRGFEDVTVRQYSWVAGRVAEDTRVSKLPWTMHRAVAALPPGEQEEWLKRAQEENLTSKDLNRAIHGEKPKVKRWSLGELREERYGTEKQRIIILAFLDWLEVK